MKTTIKLFAVAVAVAAVSASCSKNEMEPIENANVRKVTIKVNADKSELTKTAVDGSNNVSWSAGDKIGIFQSIDGVKGNAKTTSSALAAAAAKATFSVALDAADGSEFKYIAAYPSSAVEYSTDTTYVAFGSEYSDPINTRINDSTLMMSKSTEKYHERFRVIIPRVQKPTESSWDPAADVLLSKVVSMATQPEELNMEFHRLGTAVKMTINGLTSGETIKYVDFSTTEAKICGRAHFNPLTGSIYDKGYDEGGYVIHMIPAAARTTTGSDVFWFRVLADTLSNNFTVAVVTDNARYTKTVNLQGAGRTLVFAEEGLTTFAVSDIVRSTAISKSTSTSTDLDRTSWVVSTSHPVFQEKPEYSTKEFAGAICDADDNTRFCMIRPGKGPVRTADGTSVRVSKTETTWFQFDLGSAQTVSYLRVRNRPKSAGQQLRLGGIDEVLGSNDGATWITVAKDIKVYNGQNVEESDNIPIPTSTFRYYRFTMQAQKCFYQSSYISSGNTWQVREFYLGN